MAAYKLEFSRPIIPCAGNTRVLPHPNDGSAFAISNNTLYKFNLSNENPRIRTSKDNTYPLGDAVLLHVEHLDDEQKAIIVKTTQAIRIYLHSNNTLSLAVEDDKYHDAFMWNKPENTIQFGHFYHDPSLLGMMTTHTEYGTKLYAIFKDILLSGDFPIHELETNTNIFEAHCPNSTLRQLALLRRGSKNSIVSQNRDGICLFELNEKNGIEIVMKVSHGKEKHYDGGLYMADLTHQRFNDIVAFNTSGMFVYQQDNLIHYNPLFSAEKGWSQDHTKSIRFEDVNSDGFVDMVFNGPKGITAITFDQFSNTWTYLLDASSSPPSMRHARLINVIPQDNSSYMFANFDNSLYWAKLKPSSLTWRQEPRDLQPTWMDVARSISTLPRTGSSVMVFEPIALLRDMDIWKDILNCVRANTGKPKFSIPLITMQDPGISLAIHYDATSGANDVLGMGWSMPLNLITRDDNQSVFEEDAVYVIAFQDSPQALKLLPDESNSTVRSYSIPAAGKDFKFRARHHLREDLWVIDLGSGVKQVYGHIPSANLGAVSKDVIWKNWHSVGFDDDERVERSRMWFLAKIQDELDNDVIEFSHFTDERIVNTGLRYTNAVYLKKSRDYHGNEVEFRYQEKEPHEYRIYDARDQDENYNWIPVETRYLSGYTLSSPSLGRQTVNFTYYTANGLRLLTGIRQTEDVLPGPVVQFEYNKFPMDKFSISKVHLPYGVNVEFSYIAVGDGSISKELKRMDVSPGYKVLHGEDYVLVSYLKNKSPDQVVLRMFNGDMTKELYTSESRVEHASKGRWPLLGEHGAVVDHEVIQGDDFFGVVLYYVASKWLCLFGYHSESDIWLRETECRQYGEASVIKAGEHFLLVTDLGLGVELLEWKSFEKVWTRHVIISSSMHIAIAVKPSRFVTYDDNNLLLGHKSTDGAWKLQNLLSVPGCLNNTETILKRFNLRHDVHKVMSGVFRNNMLKFSHNLVALNCLQIKESWSRYQLSSSLKLFTIDSSMSVSHQEEAIVDQDDLKNLTTDQERDSQGNLVKFYYERKTNGSYVIGIKEMRGTLYEELKASQALDQLPKLKDQYKSLMNPAGRFLFDVQNYIMSFSDKVIALRDQKLSFGGVRWRRNSMPEEERKRQKFSIPVGDKFILEKKSKNAAIQLLRKGSRELVSNLAVNMTDVRVFYPVYLAWQTKNTAANILEFSGTTAVKKVLSASETISPYSTPFKMITHAGDGGSQYVIFREQYGIRKFLPNYVVNQLTVVFDSDRKKRVTGFEYRTDGAKLMGNTVSYTERSLIPGNDKSSFGRLSQSLTDGNSTAFDSKGRVVKHIPHRDEPSNEDADSEKEDALRKATTFYDRSGKLEIAQCAPFSIASEMVSYYGFEDYERNVIGRSKQWSFQASNIIRNGFALTGRNYLHLKDYSIEGVFQPSNQNSEYIASSWIRLQNVTQIPRIGEVSPHFKAILLTDTDQAMTSLISVVKFRLDNWIYVEMIIDLPFARRSSKIGNQKILKIAIRAGPMVNVPIDVDHVRFMPLTADFKADVFDPVSGANIAAIGPTGSIQRRMFDVYNTIVGKVTEESQVQELTVYTKAHARESGSPRCTVTVRPETGFYEQFSPFSFGTRWSVNEKNPWSISPYQLEHHSHDINILELTSRDISSESYGFQMLYKLTGDHASLAANSYFELMKQFDNCSLKVATLSQQIPSRGEILFVKEFDRIFVWIDGNLMVDQTSTAEHKPLKISMKGWVSIKNMSVFSKASINVKYQNSLDEITQEIHLETSESIVVKEKLYDELGRQRVTTQHVRIVKSKFEPLLRFNPKFVSNGAVDQANSVWKTGLLEGLATEITGHPYAFVETRYADNPLNEKIMTTLPGRDFSTSGTFAKRFAAHTPNLFVANRFSPSMNVTFEVELKPGGFEDVTVLNEQNKKIAQFVHTPGSRDLFSTYKLNKDGNLVQSLPPLYFEKIGSFHKTNSQLLTITKEDERLQRKLGVHIDYGTNGKPIRKTTADAGPVENVYDKDKLLRFVIYYSYAEPTVVETIIYFNYDQLQRVVGTGQFLNNRIPKDQLLNVTLTKENSLRYQTYNYATFERDPNLRGRLLRTITMNGVEPFVEVLHVNERGDVLDKRFILLSVTKTPDEIVISKRYMAGQVRALFYPAKFLGKPFTVVYGIDRMGRINSIGTTEDPTKFLRIAYNAAGQVTEETYEPSSEYSFKSLREYNEPSFLTNITTPFLSEEISYTEFSYGGVPRGDGTITRVRFSAHWHRVASSAGVGLNPSIFVNDFMTLRDSKICFEALRNAGYLDEKLRQTKAFYPELEIEFPIICTAGISGRHVSNVLGRYGYPGAHGYRFDYGVHKDLTKAKYFAGPDEPQPLQPGTFAREIRGISTNSSQRIWEALRASQFLIEVPDQTNVSTSQAKQGQRSFMASRLFEDLRNVKMDYATYAEPLRKLLTLRYFKRQGSVSVLEMQDIIRKWLGNLPANFVQRTAADIVEMLRQKRYFFDPLDSDFKSIMREFQGFLPEIVRVLFTYFARQLGRSEFDVESYEIDANGNHRTFNAGYDHYALKYEDDSNRLTGVRYKSFNSAQPEKLFSVKHDSRGNVIQALHKGIQSMEYHPVSNLLQRVRMSNGSVVQFYYDSKGERVLKRLSNSEGKIRKEMHYLRDDQGRTLVERELSFLMDNQPPVVLVTMYVYGPNGLVGFVRRDQFFSVITDHQGSVRLVVRDGEVVAAYDYLPYGSIMRIFGPDPEAHIPYRYTGQEWDPEIGLYNYHARLYDPSIGRFYQIDPKEQYFSPYKYAGNSPISMVDPSGEIAITTIILIVSLISMAVGTYLGGSAANGSFTKWDFTKLDTYLGMFFGGLTGYFMPGGLVASVTLLAGAVGMTLAIGITVSVGLTLAYVSMGAANGSYNPADWDFSSPRTWYAFFDGFSMGVSAPSGLRNAYKIYKELGATGKKLFIGATFITGTGLFVMGGVATNWDIKNPQFLFATVSSILAAPDAVIFGKNSFRSMKKGWKNMRTNFGKVTKNYEEVWETYMKLRTNYGRTRYGAFMEILDTYEELIGIAKTMGSSAAVGVSAFLLGTALTHGFQNVNMTDMSTYHNVMTSLQLGTQFATFGKRKVAVGVRKLRLTKTNKALEMTNEVADLAAKAYQKILVENKPIIDDNIAANEYSQMTIDRLSENRIPNAAMSVVVLKDVIMVGFSSNKAPGLFLVYQHDNFQVNPTFKASRFEPLNKNVGGEALQVRDDPFLNARIKRAVDRVQAEVLRTNKILFEKEIYGKLKDINLEGDGRLVTVETRERFADAIRNEVLLNGFVKEDFIPKQFAALPFENDSIRAVTNNILQRQTEIQQRKSLLKSNISPEERRKIGPELKALEKDLRMFESNKQKIIQRDTKEFAELLYKEVEKLGQRRTTWDITNCAEPHALSALQRQAEVFQGQKFVQQKKYDIALDVEYMATYKTDKMPSELELFQRCDHCKETTSLVRNVLSDDGFMSSIKNSADEAVFKLNSAKERLQFLQPMTELHKVLEEERQKKERPRRSLGDKGIPNSADKQKNTEKTILDFGDEFLSKVDVNGTLLLADVIAAKCHRRKIHRVSGETAFEVNRAELLCNLLQLFEESIEEAAARSRIIVNEHNVDGYTMQQEVMRLVRKHRFAKISRVMLRYALDALDDDTNGKAIAAFKTAFLSLKLSERIEIMLIKLELNPRVRGGMDMAYNARHGQEYNVTIAPKRLDFSRDIFDNQTFLN